MRSMRTSAVWHHWRNILAQHIWMLQFSIYHAPHKCEWYWELWKKELSFGLLITQSYHVLLKEETASNTLFVFGRTIPSEKIIFSVLSPAHICKDKKLVSSVWNASIICISPLCWHSCVDINMLSRLSSYLLTGSHKPDCQLRLPSTFTAPSVDRE